MRNIPPDYSLAIRDPERFRLLAEWLPMDLEAPILDVGCGWGQLLLGLWASGYRNLTGVELSKEQFDIARASLPKEIRLVHADAKEFLKHPGESFRLVTVFDVIEHLEKPDGLNLLRLVFGAIAPPGSVVIRTPNMACLIAGYTRHNDITHVAGYTEWSLFQLLDMAGFVAHKIIGPTVDRRCWRWYAPYRGFGLGLKLADCLHSLIYRLVALRPFPTALGYNLTVESFKK
jgi:2-polyprenyl-3-methyl-5-hydroxy-6-metoxy-1,4-benzoquinol methylase